MQITISQYVDVEVDMDDIRAEDLAKALVKKPKYRAALDKALHGDKSIKSFNDEADEVRELIEAYKCGKPIEPIIASLAYSKYGWVC
jgi:hypothetical protein